MCRAGLRGLCSHWGILVGEVGAPAPLLARLLHIHLAPCPAPVHEGGELGVVQLSYSADLCRTKQRWMKDEQVSRDFPRQQPASSLSVLTPGQRSPRPLLDPALVRAGTLGSTAPPRPSPGTRPGKPRSRVGGAVSPTVAGQVHPRMQDTAGAPSPRPGHLGRRSHRDGQPQRPLEGQPQDGDTALAPAWPHTVQQSPLP